MPSQADVQRFSRANRDIRKLLTRDVSLLWGALDHSDVLAAKAALLALLPPLIVEYGDVAAVVAADFYEAVRADSRASRTRFGSVLAPTVETEAVESAARWSLTPMFQAKPDAVAVRGRLVQAADRLVLHQSDRTIGFNVERDPTDARWAWIPQGETCAWCRMKGSRGAVFRTADSANSGRHADCDCVSSPFWPDTDYPAGYDPDALYEEYRQAADAASSGSPKAILAEMRGQAGTN